MMMSMGKEMIKCALCGFEFEEGQKVSCKDCPMNYSRCNFEKCPNCGYDTPKESFLWSFSSRVVKRLKGIKRK